MNRWKNIVWMAAGVAALTVVGAFTAKPLLAQIKAALVQNVDEPGRSPYSSTAFLNAQSCFFGTDCILQFGRVPAGKRLIATNLTGQIDIAPTGSIRYLRLDGDGPDAGHSRVQVPPTLLAGVDSFDGSIMFGVNATVMAIVSAGEAPVAFFASTTLASQTGTRLTLSGYLIDCAASSCAPIVH